MRENCFKRPAAATKILAAAALLSLAGCAGPRIAVENPSPWSTYLHDDARSNYTAEALTLPLAVSWSADLSGFEILRPHPKEQLASPVIAGGKVYSASTNGKLYSADIATGDTGWKFKAGRPLEGTPAVTDGQVCFGSANGVLRCLDKGGKELWSFQARSEIISSPVVSGDTVYAASGDDRLHALKLSTGEKLWGYGRTTFQSVAPRLYSSPVSASGRLYHLFSDGWLVCLDAQSGTEIWSKKAVRSFEGSQQTRRTPYAGEGSVYVIDEKNAVLELDGATGDVRRAYNAIKAHDFIVPDRRMIVLAGADQIVAMDRLTGAILWKRPVDKGALSTVFAAGEHLFVLSNYKTAFLGLSMFEKTRGRIEAVSLKDGSVLWKDDIGSDISAAASSSGRRLALITNEGILKVYGP